MKDSNQQGWVRLHRKITDNPLWFSEPFTRPQAWIDLFLNANHKKGAVSIRGNVVKIKRGQIGWSELTMAKRWAWSKGKVRRFLKLLEAMQQIKQQKSTLTTITTIIEYEKYQSDNTTGDTAEIIINKNFHKNKNDTTEKHQSRYERYSKNSKNDTTEKALKIRESSPNNSSDDTTEIAEKRQQRDYRRYTNKNEKNEKNEKNKKNKKYSNISCGENFINQVFDIFYQSVNPMINFGNKTSRDAAQFLIDKLGLDKTIELAKYACSVQGEKYAPTISTPYQLKERFTALGVFSQRKSEKQHKGTVDKEDIIAFVKTMDLSPEEREEYLSKI